MRYILPTLLILVSSIFVACSDQQSIQEGQKYGQEKSVFDCNNRAMEMITECRVTECDFEPADFAKGCASVSTYDKKYCEGMPLDSSFKVVKWIEEQCAGHKNPKACGDVLKHAAGRCIVGFSQSKSEAKASEGTEHKEQTNTKN